MGGAGREVPLSDYEQDEVHGVTEGGDLDRYLFRTHGLLTFQVPIDRVFTKREPSDPEYGPDWDKILTGPVIFRMAVYDVDRTGGPYPEEDRVYLNGRALTRRCTNDPFLDGSNDAWSLFEAEIPIEWFKDGTIKTAKYVGPGQPPQPGINTIEVDIDTRYPNNTWAVEVDWGAFYIRAVRPVLFVHGMNDGPHSWNWMRQQMPGKIAEARQIHPLRGINANAPFVREHIETVKREYGVDELNVVGHSRGGLDCYEAAYRDGSGIENLITIGSPLRGSQVADEIRSAFLFVWQLQIALLAIRWETTLLDDLTTYGRSLYYWNRGGGFPIPGVAHYSIAGVPYFANEHSPRWYRSPYNYIRYYAFPLFSPFSDDQDGLVQRNHAHHPFFSGVDFDGPWGHHEADTYNGLPGPSAQPYSPTIAELIWQRCRQTAATGAYSPRRSQGTQGCPPLAPVSPPPPQVLGAPDVQLTPIDVREYAAGELLTSTFQVDSSVTSASFLISADAGTLLNDLVLELPSGQLLHPGDPIPGGSFEFSESGGVLSAAYHFNSLSSGVYRIHALSSGSGRWMTLGIYQSDLGISPTMSANEIPVGGNTTITTTVDWPGGSEPAEAFLEARIRRESGSGSLIIPLSWNGNTYEGVFSPTLAGSYTVEVVAVAPGFERAGMNVLRVRPNGATIGGPIQSTGRDLNANALFDKLEVRVPVEVAQPGRYRLSADLETSDGTFLGGAEALLETSESGVRQAVLSFDGRTIRNTGIDGPYRVIRAVLLDESEGVFLECDRAEELGTTQAFLARQFEGELLEIGTGGSDFGVDTNGNGQYDWLRVMIPVVVDAQATGHYQFNAELADAQGRRIMYSQAGSASLAQGSNLVALDFRGRTIADALADGPYRVVNLYLYSNDGQHSLSRSEVQETQSYRYFQFEGAPIVIDAVTFDPNPVIGGRTTTVTVNLVARSLGQQTYAVAGSSMHIQSMPRNVSFAAGQRSANFVIRTRPVSRRTEVPITFTRGVETFQARLVLLPVEAKIASITFLPVELRSRQSTTMTIRLDRAPTSDATIHLTQDAPILDLPSTATVRAGSREVSVRIAARPVQQQRRAIVTARLAESSKSARVLVNP